jgi:hypothetical protein
MSCVSTTGVYASQVSEFSQAQAIAVRISMNGRPAIMPIADMHATRSRSPGLFPLRAPRKTLDLGRRPSLTSFAVVKRLAGMTSNGQFFEASQERERQHAGFPD